MYFIYYLIFFVIFDVGEFVFNIFFRDDNFLRVNFGMFEKRLMG